MEENKIYKEIVASKIIIPFIVTLIILTWFINSSKFMKLFNISISCYFLTLVFLIILNLLFKNNRLEKITRIISFPIAVMLGILTVIIPFWTLLIHFIYYFGIAISIPVLLYEILMYFNFIDFIKKPTADYLEITATVFISVLLNPFLRRIVYLVSPVRMKTSKKLKPYELDKLTDYFLSSNNVRFLVYTAYGIALITIHFYNFQGFSLNKGESLIASFETFIAFDASLVLLKLLDFKPSELITKILNSISNKLTEEDKNSR